MTAERIKEIQQQTAYPNSISVQQALLQVWNECSQTEISDEEIRKAAESQATFAPSFVRGVEWYREQLKQKQ